jgi:hypothetical protein
MQKQASDARPKGHSFRSFAVTYESGPEGGYVVSHKFGGLVPNLDDLGYSKTVTFSTEHNAEAWAEECHAAYAQPKFVHPATPYVTAHASHASHVNQVFNEQRRRNPWSAR